MESKRPVTPENAGSSPAPPVPLAWYWINTGWGCGSVGTDEKGIIRDGAPIFKKLRGQNIDTLPGRYLRERLK